MSKIITLKVRDEMQSILTNNYPNAVINVSIADTATGNLLEDVNGQTYFLLGSTFGFDKTVELVDWIDGTSTYTSHIDAAGYLNATSIYMPMWPGWEILVAPDPTVGPTDPEEKDLTTIKLPNDDTIYKIADAQAREDIEEIKDVIGEGGSSASGYGLPISSTMSDEYLTYYDYDSIDWKAGKEFSEAFTTPGACTVVVDKNNRMLRNFDWKYDNSKTGFIKTNGAKHKVMGCVNIREDITLDDNMLKAMPFAIVDGINDTGLQVAVLVIPKQEHSGDIMPGFGPNQQMPVQDTIPNNMVVRYLLENFDTAASAIGALRLSVKIKQSPKLSAMGYETQWILSDNNHTFVLEPQTSQYRGEYVTTLTVIELDHWVTPSNEEGHFRHDHPDYAKLPVLTNFRVSDRGLFSGDGYYVMKPADIDPEYYIQRSVDLHSSGLERYDNAVDMLLNSNPGEELTLPSYSQAYTDPTRFYSDFVDTNHGLDTIVTFVDAHLTDIANAYNNRERNGELWQTVHSVIMYTDQGQIKLYGAHQEQDVRIETIDGTLARPVDPSFVRYNEAGELVPYATGDDVEAIRRVANSPATTEHWGVVQPDGETITVTEDGVISAVKDTSLAVIIKEVI